MGRSGTLSSVAVLGQVVPTGLGVVNGLGSLPRSLPTEEELIIEAAEGAKELVIVATEEAEALGVLVTEGAERQGFMVTEGAESPPPSPVHHWPLRSGW